MTTIEFEAPTWDGVDARLAELQPVVRYGINREQGAKLIEKLAAIRADLAVLRAVERAERGTPVVARFLEPVAPVASSAATPSPPPQRPHPDTATARETAITSGYTGDACPDCGQFMMVNNGTCLKCMSCGATTGCS